MCIGLKIKELARKENITLAELAKRLGKTKQAVYEMVEKDDINTSILRQLSTIFKIPISAFFAEEKTQQAIANGNGVAAIGHEVNISSTDSAYQEKIAYLESLLKEKEERLAEKERLIKVLMDKEK